VSSVIKEKAETPPVPFPSDRIKRLPTALRAELDLRIAQQDFSGFRDLKNWLRQRGYSVTTDKVQYYTGKLEERLAAVRMASEQARAIVEASGDDDVDMNQALLRLLQQHLFTVLVELNRVDLNRANLPALARSVAGLARTSIEQRKYADEIRAGLAKKVAEAQKEVDKAAACGLTEDGAKQIKRVLMEITE
jgi:Protein of unknown function (DUF3486)